MLRTCCLATFHLIATLSIATAGPFDSYSDSAVSPASVVAWAKFVDDYSPTPEVVSIDSFGGGPHDDPTRGLGAADGATVSLGDLDSAAIGTGTLPGSITVEFQATLFDGPGNDFAVFENAGVFFDSHSTDFIFAELAFVEVSSNGTDFARFPSTSLNLEVDGNVPDPNLDQLHAPFGRNFAGLNTTNVDNLAGVHPSLFGTPFDLNELIGDALVTQGAVDLQDIRFVRMVDIPGDGSVLDANGNAILDAWHTIESGGFDLDAVGALNAVPEPNTLVATMLASAMLYVTRRRRAH